MRRGRRRLVLGVASMLVLLPGLAGAGPPSPPAARAADAPAAWVRMPFDGYWDRFGLAHPSRHPTGGHWAVDVYAAPGTAVRARFGAPAGVRVQLRVNSVYPTCSRAGGRTVTLDVYGNGAKLGWVAYAHLGGIPAWVRAGASIPLGSQLGMLGRWPYERGCWEVLNDAGVHLHLAAADYSGYACYRSLASGELYVAGVRLGKVGRTPATGIKQACG